MSTFTGACSHRRAKYLYAESILLAENSKAFLSKQCDSWEQFEKDECNTDVEPISMGEGLSKNE